MIINYSNSEHLCRVAYVMHNVECQIRIFFPSQNVRIFFRIQCHDGIIIYIIPFAQIHQLFTVYRYRKIGVVIMPMSLYDIISAINRIRSARTFFFRFVT